MPETNTSPEKQRRRHPALGVMKGTLTVAPGVDLTQPAFPEWADIAEESCEALGEDAGGRERRETIVTTTKIISPIDCSVYAERPLATDAMLDAASSPRPRRAGGVGAGSRRRARQADPRRADVLVAMNDEIVPELAWQMGRPIRYGAEKRGLEERARYMAGIAEEALAPLVPKELSGFRRYVKREPAGIVLVIAPWNYPFLTAGNTIFPALMAGNAVILKHAAQTLLVGERFQQAGG